MNYFSKKLEKMRSKRSLHEYGSKIKSFQVPGYGLVQYAQWLHPYEGEKEVNQAQLSFYSRFIKPGGMVIDIGAHTGDTTVPMAVCAGKDGIILGLEPNPYVYKILDENSHLNPELTHIVPLNFAATDTDGKFTFNYSDASFCNGGFFQKIKNQKHGHKYTLEVEGRNFEKYLAEHYSTWLPKLCLVKVDAEGYDKEILKSIINVLKAYKPAILSECNKHLLPDERFELYNVLRDIGYNISMVPNFEVDTLVPLHSQEDMLRWKHFDIVAQ